MNASLQTNYYLIAAKEGYNDFTLLLTYHLWTIVQLLQEQSAYFINSVRKSLLSTDVDNIGSINRAPISDLARLSGKECL
jgi:hypothetical protein